MSPRRYSPTVTRWPWSTTANALSYLRSHPPPDLIVLDMLMPVVDGWHFLARLRQLAGCADIPVVVVTGLELASREWVEALGAVGLLKKPPAPVALLDVVRSYT